MPGAPGSSVFLFRLLYLLPSRARDHMVVDHAHGLHERITDGGTTESKPPFLEVFAQGVGDSSRRGDFLEAFEPVDGRFMIDEIPEVAVERAEFLLNLEKGLGVPDRALDLQAVPDDALVLHQSMKIFPGEHRDLFDIPVRECFLVGWLSFQNGCPGETGLRSFKSQELKESLIVMDRHTPYVVVIVPHGLVLRPATSAGVFHV